MWIFFDKGIRDGDEEGIVGAAELHFLVPLREGRYQDALTNSWVGETGEYPPMGYAIMGTWWWLAQDHSLGEPHQPNAPIVRSILLMSLLVAAGATASLLRRNQEGSETSNAGELCAFITVLCLPLSNGLSRHFMLEGLLIGCVALAILAAVRAAEHPGVVRYLLLGVVLGIGLLVKQTFSFYVALPVIWILASQIFRHPLLLLLAVATTALIALPWYVQSWADQSQYLQDSYQSHSEASSLDQLLYYPTTLWWHGFGPVLCIGIALALLTFIRDQHHGEYLSPFQQRRALLGLVWLLGGLLILMWIPKKYPRLIAPLTPAIGLILGAWLMERVRSQRILALGSSVLFGWMTWVSWNQHTAPALVESVDPGNIQQWIRPPNESDLGLHAASVAIKGQPPGSIWVIQPPEIPTEIQTTSNWGNHLIPYLRRQGMSDDTWQVVLLYEGSSQPEEAPSAQLVWGAIPPDVEVPELQTGFQVRGSIDSASPDE